MRWRDERSRLPLVRREGICVRRSQIDSSARRWVDDPPAVEPEYPVFRVAIRATSLTRILIGAGRPSPQSTPVVYPYPERVRW